jgi:hypothetical protein
MCAVAVLVAGCGATGPPANLRRPEAPSAKLRRADGIPRQLLTEVRPIGRGPRFEPPVKGPVPGACAPRLGPRLEAHIEVFGANRVVLLPAGIGTGAPRAISDGRITRARCFGDLVTLDPSGIVYFRAGTRLTLGDLFTAWGQSLGSSRIASFAGGRVRVFLNGWAAGGSPRAIALMPRAEIVLEVGPRVPPHTHFTFPPAPSPKLG